MSFCRIERKILQKVVRDTCCSGCVVVWGIVVIVILVLLLSDGKLEELRMEW
jgi:hypothetical protein